MLTRAMQDQAVGPVVGWLDYVRRGGGQISTVRSELLAGLKSRRGVSLRWLHLALNEAEALALQTDFPALVFPELAAEKVNALNAWAENQATARRASAVLTLTA